MPPRAQSPHLRLRRIVVTGDLTLDLSLRPGLNVLYASPALHPAASNQAGKTALIELIRYGLGRRDEESQGYHFETIRKRLDTLYVEFEANDRVLTTKRSLQNTSAHMSLYPGPYSPELAGSDGERVPLADISNVLLSQLGIPAVSVKTHQGDLTPLSFSLLMRAFVLHQKDSFGAVLDKVYPDARKAQILGFLTKIIPVDSWDYQAKLAAAQQRATQLERRFEGTREFLLENGIASISEAERALDAAESSYALAVGARHGAQEQIRAASPSTGLVGGRLDGMRSELLEVQSRRASLSHTLVARQAEAERISALIASLRADAERSQRMFVASTVLSTVDFDLCPRCLQDITPDMRERERYHRCLLCSRPLTMNSDAIPRAAPASADLSDQVAEAELILKDVHEELSAIGLELNGLAGAERRLASQVEDETRAYVSPAVDQLLAFGEVVARTEGAVASARVRLQQAQALRDLSGELDRARNDYELLQQEYADALHTSKQRKQTLRRTYEELLRAVDFPRLRTLRLDRSLMPIINNGSYTHTGTAYTGLATVVYHLALLKFALTTDTFFPDFLAIDSPAVGDLNDESHDRLLNYLADVQSGAWGEPALDEDGLPRWQIILTTRRRTEALEEATVMEISGDEGEMLLRAAPRRKRVGGRAEAK